MIEKVFKNVQSLNLLSYSITMGHYYGNYIAGKGMYGNRVSTIRSKDPKKLYTMDSSFKDSEFLTIEGLKSLELPFTILNTRQRLESFFTSQECMYDFLSTFSKDYLSDEDVRNNAELWYNNVGKKLLSSNILDFSRLNNFVLGSIVLYLPLSVQLKVAEFRQEQILNYLTQDIVTADYAKAQLDILPASKEKLVELKQKLIKQRSEKEKQRVVQNNPQALNGELTPKLEQNMLGQSTQQVEEMSKTVQTNFNKFLDGESDYKEESRTLA